MSPHLVYQRQYFQGNSAVATLHCILNLRHKIIPDNLENKISHVTSFKLYIQVGLDY